MIRLTLLTNGDSYGGDAGDDPNDNSPPEARALIETPLPATFCVS